MKFKNAFSFYRVVIFGWTTTIANRLRQIREEFIADKSIGESISFSEDEQTEQTTADHIFVFWGTDNIRRRVYIRDDVCSVYLFIYLKCACVWEESVSDIEKKKRREDHDESLTADFFC